GIDGTDADFGRVSRCVRGHVGNNSNQCERGYERGQMRLRTFQGPPVDYYHLCEERKQRSNPGCLVTFWIASRSLSTGAHSRDPLTRNDDPRDSQPMKGVSRLASLDLPCLFRQHDRNAVTDRIGELCRTRDQLLPGCVEFE